MRSDPWQPGAEPLVGETATRQCLLCGGECFTDLHVPNGVVMRRCEGCGLYVNATPEHVTGNPHFYAAAYHEHHYGGSDRRKQRTSVCLVRQIEALVSRRGRILDIGCSLGHFLAAAAQRGWDAWGVDVSADMVRHCQEQGLQARSGGLGSLPFPDGYFDVIHARHVLEHDIEVFRSLAEMRRALADHGLLFVVTPDAGCPKVRRRGAGYVKFWKPDHMVCFTRSTLTEAMRRAGFAEVRTPPAAGLWVDGPGGAVQHLIWWLSDAVPDALGQGKTLRTVWRKA